MRYLLDTNTANDYIHNHRDITDHAKRLAKDGHRIGISMPVLAELLFGVENSQNRDRNMKLVKIGMNSLVLRPFDEDAAHIYGKLQARLRSIGRTIGTMDVLIASTALSISHCTVVTSDSDFQAIPGLTIENWRM